MIWPIIMALWVKSSFQSPSGPFRDNNIYTVNPTTTAGSANSVLNVEINARRPGNCVWARIKPITSAKGAAINIARNDTLKEIATISHNAGSPVKRRTNACQLAVVSWSTIYFAVNSLLFNAIGTNSTWPAILKSWIMVCADLEVNQLINSIAPA